VSPAGPSTATRSPPPSPCTPSGASSNSQWAAWARTHGSGVPSWGGRVSWRCCTTAWRGRAGQGQVVALIGDPEMGKSRLLIEFCRRLPASRATWYVGHCRSYGQAIPYRPLLDVLHQLCGIEGESTDAVNAAVRRCLQESGRDGWEEVALMGPLLDLPGTPEQLTRPSRFSCCGYPPCRACCPRPTGQKGRASSPPLRG
jgi:hypothetical protein